MTSIMHDLTRHKELVQKRLPKGANTLFDPNSFPIQKLSGELVEFYDSLWDLEKEELQNELKRRVGYTLTLKDS